MGIEMALRIRFLLSSADRAFSLWLKIKYIHVTCYRLWVYVAQPVVHPSGKSFFVCRHSFPWIEQEPISCERRGGGERKNSPPFTIDVIGKQKNVASPSPVRPSALCPTSLLSHVPSKAKKANLGKQGIVTLGR